MSDSYLTLISFLPLQLLYLSALPSHRSYKNHGTTAKPKDPNVPIPGKNKSKSDNHRFLAHVFGDYSTTRALQVSNLLAGVSSQGSCVLQISNLLAE